MPAAYSVDLRKRVMSAYEKGEGTQEEIAQKYSISLSALQKWIALKNETGEIVPRVPSTRGRACILDEEKLAFIRMSVKKKADIIISELIEGLKKSYQCVVSQSMVSRALKKLNLRRKKKSVYAQEQDRADVKKKREDWGQKALHLKANDLIFIDESGLDLRMALQYARAEGGERIKMAVPCNRGAQVSIIGAISSQGIEAALYGEWATDGDIFYAFIEECLAPKLRPGHVVIMDNVRFHYRKDIAPLIEAKGATVVYLPPYSPDFSPIENMWSKMKGILRSLMPRSMIELQDKLKNALESITTCNLLSWFKHCGYNA